MCMFMAGMVAEELFLHERHNSGGGDIPAIDSLLWQMERGGMLGTWAHHSEPKRKKAVADKHEKLWARTRAILEKNTDAERALVDALMERKELTEDQIMEVVGSSLVSYHETGEF